MNKHTAHQIYLHAERGFSLMSAIFLLVVISVIGTIAVTISGSQQKSIMMDEMGSRTYQAALAGMEWGMYQIVTQGKDCASITQPVMPAGTQLAAFTVVLQCELSMHPSLKVYHLKATASVDGTSPDQDGFFERQIEKSFSTL